MAKSEIVNGVLVFRPDELTDKEIVEWRRKAFAETKLYWEVLNRRKVNTKFPATEMMVTRWLFWGWVEVHVISVIRRSMTDIVQSIKRLLR